MENENHKGGKRAVTAETDVGMDERESKGDGRREGGEEGGGRGEEKVEEGRTEDGL